MDVDDEDALLSLAFSMRGNPGAYALLIGAGVSAAAGMPTAWGVLTDLISRVAGLADDKPDGDPLAWYERRYGVEPRYEKLLERLAPSPIERQRLLQEYFEPADPDADSPTKKPTVAHHAIARLVRAGAARVIITLNFDRLIEQALHQAGVEPTVVVTPVDADALAPLHTLSCCVIHLHGDYRNPGSMLNTTSELYAYNPKTAKLLARVLQDYGLVIAGWSATYDPGLRTAIKKHYPSRYMLAGSSRTTRVRWRPSSPR